jgi:hypothetical protein
MRCGRLLRCWGRWLGILILLTVGCERTSSLNRIPTIEFASPLEGTSVAAGSVVVLEALAQDQDGVVASVTFSAGGQPFATLTRASYIAEWQPPGPGSYTISARAVDNLGASSLPASIRIIVTPAEVALKVTVVGPGAVSSPGAGLDDCTGSCTINALSGTELSLRAAPRPGFAVESWHGCEGGHSTCRLTIEEDTTVNVTFAAGVTLRTLVDLQDGANGLISINDDPCESSCAFVPSSAVTLTAVAGEDSSFAGWGGVCAATRGSICNLVLEQGAEVSATFTYTPGQPPLSVILLGQGSGKVVSEPIGISCPTDCTENFPSGTTLTLTALGLNGDAFVGWGDACAGAAGPDCTVTLDQARRVSARFETASLRISPTAARVAVRGDLELSATAVGLLASDLVWQTSAGTIRGNGLTATLTAPLSAGVVTVSVSSTQLPSVRSQARITVFEGLSERFMIVALPDTQNYLCSICPLSANKWHPATFRAQTQWAVDNQSKNNIAFVTHLGDIIETANRINEWQEADQAMAILDGKIPYAVAIGDHDFYPEEVRDPALPLNSTYVKQFFGQERYKNYNWYVGASPNNLSHAQLFEAGGRQFLHIALEWEAHDSAIDWATGIIQQYPGVPTIVSTHAYVSNITRGHSTRTQAVLRTGQPDTQANSGRDIYNKLVRPNPQIFMVLNGHYHDSNKNLGPTDEDGEWHQISKNNAGKDVYEMLSNYQDFQNGGDGWLRTIEFIPRGGVNGLDRIQMRTYSPTRNAYRTGRYSQFYFDLSFAERFDG